MGFLRQKHYSGLPFPTPGDLPDPGIEPTSPALAGGFFTSEPLGKPITTCTVLHRWTEPGASVLWMCMCQTGNRSQKLNSMNFGGKQDKVQIIAFPLSVLLASGKFLHLSKMKSAYSIGSLQGSKGTMS